MTVSVDTNFVSYQGNGVTDDFDFSFYVEDADFLVVTLITIADGEETTINPVLYSVSGIGDPDGGTVTYPLVGSPVAGTHRLKIERIVPLTQTYDIPQEGAFNPTDLEQVLDRMVMMIQQVDAKASSVGDANVEQFALAAEESAEDAAASASAAASSATAASGSATTASGHAGTAATQASNAATSATNASNSATNAATSATAAVTSEGNADVSESNAASSAAGAAASATAASDSATTASTQATNASNSATAAAASATLADDIYDDIVALGIFVLSGAGAPDNGLGQDGWYYINTSAQELHGPKAAGVWPAGIAMTAGGGGGALLAVVDDTSPFLGGNLDINTHDITGTGNINITGDISASDDISVGDDLLLPSVGSVINWNAGDMTLTHAANTLTWAGGTIIYPNAGFQVGASVPFSDAAGTLTLQNVDALDATTEATIEAAIDTLANLTSIQGQTVTLTGSLIRSGAHALTLTTTGTTNVTLPTSGTLQQQDELLDEIAALSVDPNADSGLFFDDSAGNVAYWTPANGLEFSGTNLQITSNIRTRTIEYVIDGGGATITTGIKGYLEVPFACTINRATALGDQSGSIVVDIWKDTYANFPPLDADSITAAAPVTISAATKSQDATLTGWTTSIAAGDILAFNVDSVTTLQRATIALRVTLV